MRIRRTGVEVPGNVEKMVKKASTFKADWLSLDLEDSVPLYDQEKLAARENIEQFILAGEYVARELSVRVNPPSSRWFVDDVMWATRQNISNIVIPKVYSLEEYIFAEGLISYFNKSGSIDITLIVESPGCLLALNDIAKHSTRLTALMTGIGDYAVESGSNALLPMFQDEEGPVDDSHVLLLRQSIIAVAKAFKMDAIEALLPRNVKDVEQTRQEAKKAKRFGFDGCLVVYPPHIKMCNDVFTPSAQEVSWATEVIEKHEESAKMGRAATSVGGRPILPQHRLAAQRIVEIAEALQ